MRALHEYSVTDWLLALPAIHGVKRGRHIFVNWIFNRMVPRRFDGFLASHQNLANKTIVMTITYNNPWVVEELVRASKRNLVADALLVFDNSRKKEARRDIERICGEYGVPYFGLPFNPETHPCRNHGIAMNWIYANFVKAIRPKVFAFLDHDLIPLDRMDVNALLSGQPFYGFRRLGKWGWNLWAGYCSYDFSKVSGYALDFNNDNPRKLDTGGQNWMALYRYFDAAAMKFAERKFNSVLDPAENQSYLVQSVDGAFHVGGASYRSRGRSKIDFARYVIHRCEEGEKITELGPLNAQHSGIPLL